MKQTAMKLFTAVSCLALAVALVLTAVTVLNPGKATAAWDGTAATAFQSGSGTQTSPYVIATEAQLGLFIRSLADGTQYAGQYLILSKDMDMTGHTWDMASTFLGHLDGRGYTITADCGFMYQVGEGATVQGLNYVLNQVEDRYGICWYNYGTLANVVVKGTLDGHYLGMLCGCNRGTIVNCGGIGSVDANGPKDYDAYAALVAENYGSIASSFCAMTLEASAPGKYDYPYVHPIAARNFSTGTNTGTITGCLYDKELYTGTVADVVGLTTQEMKSSLALGYLAGSNTPYCGWTVDASFDGYPHVQHLAHNYTAYVTGYKGQSEALVDGVGTYVSLSNTGSGTIYYSTNPAVTDPTKFSAYSANQSIFLSGDATISMAVKYNGNFGAVTRQRFISLPGRGTESDPYKITQNYQLPLIAKFPEAHFVLGADLTFTDADYAASGTCPGGWTCIPTFSGVLDGKGHSITGLKGIGGGLIGTNNGTVRHILMLEHRLYGTGGSFGAIVNNNTGTVSYCYTKSAWTLDDLPSVSGSITFGPTVGGVVGDNSGTISYCRNDGIVAVTRNQGGDDIEIGGIVGSSCNRDVIGCVNTGTLVVRSTATVDDLVIGGIAGCGDVYDSKAVQTMDIKAGLDYPSYAAGIASGLPGNSCALRCIAGYTIVGGSTSAQTLYQCAFVCRNNIDSDCYLASKAQLPSDCEGLIFGVDGAWWVSNEGLLPQGVISADGHAWVLKSDQILPTCTAKGDAFLYCAICGEGKEGAANLQTIGVLGHRYTAYVSDENATCTSDGTKTARCDRSCGKTRTVADEGSMLEHSFTDKPSGTEATAASCTAAQTWFVQCDSCDAVSDTLTVSVGDPLAHTWLDATCVAAQTCETCGATQGEADPHGHSFTDGACVHCGKPGGQCGDALYWAIDGNTLTVYGTGSMYDYSNTCPPGTFEVNTAPWLDYRGTVQNVRVLEGAVSIGNLAFYLLDNVTEVELPTTVTQIGDGAFIANAFTAISIPASVTSIGESAFASCANLAECEIPSLVTEISPSLFSACTSLTSVSIPDGVTKIGASAFCSCGSLTQIAVPDSVTQIGNNAFAHCSALKTFTIPEQVTVISIGMFSASGLERLTVPATVTEIQDRAFNYCYNLTELVIPSNVTVTGSEAFNSLAQVADVYFGGTAATWETFGCTLSQGTTVHFSCTEPAAHWTEMADQPTCTADGRTYEMCECGYERNEVTTAAPGHIYDQKKTTDTYLKDEASCTAAATYYYSCVCGEKGSESFSHGDLLGHTWLDATCVAAQTCETCGTTEGQADPHGHSFYLNACKLCGKPGGQCGANLYWILDGETLTVYGTGTMYNYDSENPGWNNYRTDIHTVIIEEGATNVGQSAFRNLTNLTSLTIPDSVTEIKGYAFYNCKSLAELELPDTLTTLGWEAFSYAAVKEFTVPAGLKEIVPFMFYKWANLESVTIHENITSIGKDAFNGCTALKSVALPAGLKSIGSLAFNGAGLTALVIPQSVMEIGSSAIVCPITQLVLSSKLETVAKDALYLAKNAEIYFDGTDTQWWAYGLSLYNDERVHFQCADPDSHWETKEETATCTTDGRTYEQCACGYVRNEIITQTAPGHIYDKEVPTEDYLNSSADCDDPATYFYSCVCGLKGSETFAHGDPLNHSWLPATCLDPETCDACGETQGEIARYAHIFQDGTCATCGKPGGLCGDTLYWVMDDSDSLHIYGTGAMYHYEQGTAPWYSRRLTVTDITLTPGVTSVGSYAFSNLVRATQVTFSNTVTDIGSYAFYGCTRLETVDLAGGLRSIGDSSFKNCQKLVNITLPASLKNIYSHAFDGCKSLQTVAVPEGVTHMYDGIFMNCTGLTSVTLPDSLVLLNPNVFNGCSALTEMAIPKNVGAIATGLFYGCTALERVEIPDSVSIIEQQAFYDCASLKDIVIPEGVELLGEGAFQNCESLESVTFPSIMLELGESAFRGCKSLKTVKLPVGISEISQYLFFECSGLTSVEIPDGVETVGQYAFAGCTSLTAVPLPEDVTSIGQWAFYRCVSLPAIELPGSVAEIGSCAFVECTALTDIVLHDGLKKIGESAFSGCVKLTSVTFPGTLKEIGALAFQNCVGLTDVVIPTGVTAISGDAFAYAGVKDIYYGSTEAAFTTTGANKGTAWLHTQCTQPAGHWSAHTYQGSCTEDAYTYDSCGCGYRRNVNITKPAEGHKWTAATCTAPKTCSVCKTTEGSAAGHKWTAATCTAPKTCSVCKTTEGSAAGHKWTAATCTAPKTCSVCKTTEGSAAGHKWTAATCTAPKTCSVCKTTEGSAKGHSWKAATCSAPEKCGSCGTTRGNKLDHWDTTPKDHKCDGCGSTVGTHTDGPYWDHKCDYCGGNITACSEGLYKDHKCDGCGKTLSSCTDSDKNHTCDYCGKNTGGCVDKNLDHNCDVCGVYDGKHGIDNTPRDHKCDVCGKVMGTCTEGAVPDHKCDGCNKVLSSCADGDKNNYCDVCGKSMGCVDNNKDHACDFCDKIISTCTEGAVVDHKCDYCGKTVSNHAWKDATCTTPKICTVCGAKQGDAFGHSWNEATCIGPKICKYCSTSEGNPKGHSWNGGVITQMPTDTEPGIRTFTCTDCGMTENRRFAKDEIAVNGANRLAGSDRYKTAFMAADMLKQQLGVEKFTTVVIASGTEFADALSGSYLAAVKNAPMLLVRNNKATIAQVREYVNANLAPGGTVYILGGENAVPKTMETGLNTANVFRLGGSTRYETNLIILKEAGVGDKDILICTGKGFADSLSASAAKLPILLVKDSLNSAQKDFLKNAKGKLYIIGGTSAVNAKLENALKAYGEVKRLGGNTRYETSVLVAKTFFDKPATVAIAYAQNFPDGLSGGALAAAMDAPLILTANGKDKAAADYAKSLGIQNGYILGGNTLISDKTAKNIFGVSTITVK